MQTMILVNLLVLSMLISFSKSTPYRRREVEDVLLDFADPAGAPGYNRYFSYSYPDYETQKPKTENAPPRINRSKKMGSLSISNPMDVLRQRFILELARREQLQQQQQIKANRELLQGIGKRSTQRHDKIYPSIETRKSQFYQRKNIGDEESSNYPNLSRMDWYKIGNSDDRVNEAEQSSKMETNELHLL